MDPDCEYIDDGGGILAFPNMVIPESKDLENWDKAELWIPRISYMPLSPDHSGLFT